MKKIQIEELILLVNAIDFIGDRTTSISKVMDLLSETPTSNSDLVWCNEKNVNRLTDLLAGTILMSRESSKLIANPHLNIIVVDKPRVAFKRVLEKHFVKEQIKGSISERAVIHPTVKLYPETFIGENVVIERGCLIGRNVFIGHNTVVHEDTFVGDNVVIGCNNTIGGVGFGYEKSGLGQWEVMPHVGNVIINDNVEIGNNTCIDRAVLGSTVIGRNVKIDNLVHVAHGVKIDENSLIIAHAMLGGSARIGKNVWVGPNASIINQGIIEDNALIGMGAAVVKPVVENTIVAGNPARFFRLRDDK